nr:probable inactive receptor kinase At5g67200 [Ipomoea batatas]
MPHQPPRQMGNRRRRRAVSSPPTLFLFLFLMQAYCYFPAAIGAADDAATASVPLVSSLLPSDAVSLLSFKSKADLNGRLLYTLNERFDYCEWQGVKCAQGRVVRLVLQGFGLRGIFAADTLTRLDQLRVLSLKNNSLSGTIPDLAGLPNLKTLFLDHNHFFGAFPPSILSLHRLLILDLSDNNFTGSLPNELTVLDRLNYLRLDSNRFNGSIPALNQTELGVFNVSNNNLNGPVPVTPTLSKFTISSFSLNPNLCGEVVDKPCGASPFFNSPPATPVSPPRPLLQEAQSQGILPPPATQRRHKKTGVILGFVVGILVLIAAIVSLFTLIRRRKEEMEPKSTKLASDTGNHNMEDVMCSPQGGNGEEIKENKMQAPQPPLKSGNLMFSSGEAELYSLEQLMRASAELLGRGTLGTTYKAVMASQLIVSVKRLDAGKTSITGAEAFLQHMEAVGVLRHPNLVPVRAYFQAKQERLIIYDYQPNGSLFNLIHGSRSTRAKPLHWTSCLKIAEDVAQGLAYIHQASKLIHGNLKSSNILLASDFEACLTDYCIITLADISPSDDPDSARYKAPEARKSTRRATSASDVYSYGILLLELLSGKHPSQHPFLSPPDMPEWVRAMREDDGEEDTWLGMLVEVASICSLTSPEQRPTMRQVLKMIQDIKEYNGCQ